MKKILSTALAISFVLSSTAFADIQIEHDQTNACIRVFENRVERIQYRRAARTALGFGITSVSVLPIFTVLGTVTFGSFGVALMSVNQGMNALNKRGIMLPDSVKELMLIDQVLNPGKSLLLDVETSQNLFGRDVALSYEIVSLTKEKLMEAFIEDVKDIAHEKADLISEETVSSAIRDLLKTGELCRNKNDKKKAIFLRRVRSLVLEKITQLL